MSRTPDEWARLLGSALDKMQAADCRKSAPGLSTDCLRVMAETIACAIAEARVEFHMEGGTLHDDGGLKTHRLHA